jgi:hypothetical protein
VVFARTFIKRVLGWTAASCLIGFPLGFSLVGLQAAGTETAYRAITVKDGGSVAGTVVLSSGVEETEEFPVNKDYEACGKEPRRIHWVRVKGSRLLDAVVFIHDIDCGKPFAEADKVIGVQQERCGFTPPLQIIRDRGRLELRNLDPVMHSARIYEIIQSAQRQILNAVQERDSDAISTVLRVTRGNAIKMECSVHDFMHGWVFVARNPYYVIVDDNGTFRIDDIPAGKYRLRVWHSRLGYRETEVVISAGHESHVEFTY